MFKSIEGKRIENYIAEVFPDIAEADSASTPTGYPIRSFNMGCHLGSPRFEYVEIACAELAIKMTQALQSMFGAKPQTIRFYWRERPTFSIWVDPNQNTCVGMFIRFGLEGWGNETLSEFLGVSEDSLPMSFRSDLGDGQ
jgi:hypothetical protein